jgi:steroid delta-isomerase-like uncharacterized protein
MSAENKALVRRLYQEVWNERKVDVVDQLVSPSHALHDPNSIGSQVGPQAYKQQVLRFTTAFPDLRFTVQDMVGEKDKVAVSWTVSGTHKNEFAGVPATNQKISVDGITIHQIDKGRILDSYANWDAMGLLRQIGELPPLGQRAARSSP